MAVTDAGNFQAFQRRNLRREIAYAYPDGAAPLCGLLALMEPEETDGPEFSWLEQRYVETKSVTVGNGAGGAFQVLTGNSVTTAITFTEHTTSYFINITSGDEVKFPVNSVILVVDMVMTTGYVQHGRFKVTSNSVAGQLQVTPIETYTAVINTVSSGSIGLTVVLLGSANYEGSNSGVGKTLVHPINPGNYTQIFRNSFAFSRTALQQGLEYDRSGPYKKVARETSVEHMVGLENAILWGARSKTTATAATDSTPTTIRTLGGILYFLRDWEKGTVAEGAQVAWRPGGANITSTAWTADTDKRIIAAGGSINAATWNSMLERIFKKTTAASSEKLLLCGQGMISAINTYYEGKVTVNKNMSSEHKYGFDMRTVETNHGTLHMKSHPRFNDQTWLRNDGFVLDVPNLKLRPLIGGDTKIRKNIHANDFDGRKDEVFSELGFELRFPETHAYVRNLTAITA